MQCFCIHINLAISKIICVHKLVICFKVTDKHSKSANIIAFLKQLSDPILNKFNHNFHKIKISINYVIVSIVIGGF